jgi:hypothetical protein
MESKGEYQGVANRIRIEMDSRSPRLRLSVLGLLLDGGLKPDLNREGATKEFMEFLDELVEYLGEGLSSFTESVEGFAIPEAEAEEVKGDGTQIKEPPNIDRSGYM